MKKTRQFLLLAFILVSYIPVAAQSFAINTDGSTANASAILDVKSTAKGILVPRMTKTERNSIASPATGLMVFQNSPDSVGFYYYNGGSWSWVSSSSNGSDWKLTGNTGTDTANNFIGTTDNMALRFKINNQQAGLLSNKNTLVGLGAGKSLTTSTGIVAMGVGALGLTSIKNDLVAIGDSALYFNNSTATIINPYSTGNSAIGSKALYNNTVGYYNTAMGYQASILNISGTSNTSIGYRALFSNTSGNVNTAIGNEALFHNTTGGSNVAIGGDALWATTGNANIGIGYGALRQSLNCNYNTGIGYRALNANYTGNNNHVVGSFAFQTNTNGSYLTGIGDSINVFSNNLINATAIGAKAAVDCNNCLVLGSVKGQNNATSNVSVGIGTTTPDALLEVKSGAVLFDSTIGTTPASGAGTRMMWIPAKAAFRAGKVSNTHWNDANIGNYSVAMGENTIASGPGSVAIGNTMTASGDYSNASGYFTTASGDNSVAMGFLTTASGDKSTAMGYQSIASGLNSAAMGQGSTASGNYSTAMGQGTTASGINSTAMGQNTTASGMNSTAIGYGTIASGLNSTVIGQAAYASGYYSTAIGQSIKSKSYGGFVTGLFNDSTNAISPGSINGLNRIFQVGNGTADIARSNALTILQNGNTGIGTVSPSTTLDVNGTTTTDGLQVGNGTLFIKMQSGSATVGFSPVSQLTYSVTFPVAFTGTPKVFVTARNEPSSNYNDAFSVSIRSISNTGVSFNIQRTDSNSGWGQQLRIDWFAVE